MGKMKQSSLGNLDMVDASRLLRFWKNTLYWGNWNRNETGIERPTDQFEKLTTKHDNPDHHFP